MLITNINYVVGNIIMSAYLLIPIISFIAPSYVSECAVYTDINGTAQRQCHTCSHFTRE